MNFLFIGFNTNKFEFLRFLAIPVQKILVLDFGNGKEGPTVARRVPGSADYVFYQTLYNENPDRAYGPCPARILIIREI